jgi:hypothetical protein
MAIIIKQLKQTADAITVAMFGNFILEKTTTSKTRKQENIAQQHRRTKTCSVRSSRGSQSFLVSDAEDRPLIASHFSKEEEDKSSYPTRIKNKIDTNKYLTKKFANDIHFKMLPSLSSKDEH